ncbi:RWD domain [Trinorchestia longiramus]|nr:RWD domain [Trinorchestia longiramus]
MFGMNVMAWNGGDLEKWESMYGGEVEDLRPCNVSPDERRYLTTAVRLYLTPLDKYSPHRPDHHIMVKLKLETDNEYPNSPARYEIEDFRGITEAEKIQVQTLVESMIAEAACQGMVVFYDICREVKRYLSDHSRPHRPSEHDERLAREQELKLRQQEQEELQRRLQQEEQKLKSQKMEAANQQYLDERRAERLNMADCDSRSESLQRSVSQSVPHESPAKRRSSKLASDNCASVKTVNVFLTNSQGEEVTVEVLRTISENVEQQSYHTVYEVQRLGCHTMGVLHTWEVRISHAQARRNSKVSKSSSWEAVRMEEFLHQLKRIETEVPKLLQLSHQHIMEYEAYSVVRSRIDIKVHLLQPNLELRPLSRFINSKESLREYHVREYAEECLKGLSYLHEHGVAHGDLRDSCIFAGEGLGTLRIADFCIERILLDAVMNFLNKEAPVTYRSSGLDAMKRDIFRLGVIIISLVRGKRVTQCSPDIPRRLSPEMRDFLRRCTEPDCSLRWTARKLLRHAIFSPSDDSTSAANTAAVGDRVVPKEKTRKDTESAEGTEKRNKSLSDEPPPCDCRFVKDYEMLGLIGEGGFGRVHKVRNIVDNNVYALKQVHLNQRGREGREMQRILREVQCLSSLSHDHVVRYYTSWIEDVAPPKDACDSYSEDEEIYSETDSKTEKTTHSREIYPKIRFDDEDDDDDDEDDESDVSITFSDEAVDSDESNSIIFVDTSEEVMNSEMSPGVTEKKKKTLQMKIPPPKLLYLFIQMEYCENNTLKHAIDDNLYTKDSRLWRMFRGIINGLDYLHTKNVIHRDLKPGNIFIDGSDRVKIGDFGLATVIKNQSSGERGVDEGTLQGQLISDSVEQSRNVGTFFYIAPEFSSSSSIVQYSSKFDLYSLGIIFFEMTYVLPKSGFERHELMKKVRLPEISLPPEFEEFRYQSKKQILLKLLNHDPEKRPSTYELLNSELLPPLSREEQLFREKLQKCLQNGDYEVHDDILQAFFKPKENLSMEMDFFHLNSGPICKRTPQQVDLVIQILESIFRSYGGIWIPAPLYIPPDNIYAENRTGQKVFKVMSERGSVMTCAPELRYPFARLAVVQGWKKLRRYSIDRFYLPSRILNSDFPVGKFDCAFDYLGTMWEREELFVRILKLGQDIIKVLTDTTRHVSSNDVVLEVDHLPLAVAILSSCGVDKQLHKEVLGTVSDALQCGQSLQELCCVLSGLGVTEKSCRALKPFLVMDGLFNEILEKVIAKCSGNSQKEVLVQAKIFRRTLQKATDLGVDLTTRVQPLRFSNSSLYNDFMCRFVMSRLRTGKNSKKSYVVAKGGMFDELVSRSKDNLPPSQVSSDSVAAVGISFSLECLVAAVFSDDPKTATSSLPDLPSTSTLGCGRGDMSVCVAYVGHGSENNARMAERVQIFSELRKNNIACDLAHYKSEDDLADLSCPYLVMIGDASDKATIRYNNAAKPGVWFSQKGVNLSDVSMELLRLLFGKNYPIVQASRDFANTSS